MCGAPYNLAGARIAWPRSQATEAELVCVNSPRRCPIRGPLVCVNVFTVYVFLQHHKAHKVGKMQLVVEKIVLAILLSSVVESTAQTLRECDFKVDDVSCPRTTSLLLQLIISIVTIKTKASNPCWHSKLSHHATVILVNKCPLACPKSA